MAKIFIGIDNGVSGSIGIIQDGKPPRLIKTPTIFEQSYTKKKKNISRIDFNTLCEMMKPFKGKDVMVVIERPMVNPGRFDATLSAVRCLEATLNCIELYQLPHLYVDSKQWQKVLLPQKPVSKLKKVDKEKKKDNSIQLKKDSLDIAKRLFPRLEFGGFKDGDGILIAYWAQRENL